MLEVWLIALAHLFDRWSFELDKRSFIDWLTFFLPVLLLEIPKYHFPLVGVAVASWFGYPRVDRVRERAFLDAAHSVTVVIAGRNEAKTIESCIRSLCDQEWPNLEILVIDDASEDETHEIVGRYLHDGRVRYVRNSAAIGRGERPAGSNLGLAMANGEFIVSVDADTTFDRGMIEHMLRPFADPRVGVVGGNVLARNRNATLVTRLQTLEYLAAIDLAKRWSSLWGRTLQASGAIGGFRKSALRQIGGWDSELAEDADLSLRLVKAGWKTAFAPDAIAITDLPSDFHTLWRQRTRWDRGGFRAYFGKHYRALRPSVSGWSYAFGLWGELVFTVILPLLYPFYLVWLASQGPALFTFVLLTCFALYMALSLTPLVVLPFVSRRVDRPWALIGPALLSPFYREALRWAKIKALWLELLHVKYEDGYLPESTWANAPRF